MKLGIHIPLDVYSKRDTPQPLERLGIAPLLDSEQPKQLSN